MSGTDPRSVDEYIARYPPAVRDKLEALRAAIREEAPRADERIAYRMPAYSLAGPLVYFAVHTSHIGLYALPAAVVAFRERLAPYATSKGAIQFPLDRELPLDLIRDIVRFRIRENEAKAEAKAHGKTPLIPKRQPG